jgi:hypothetical protein
MLLLGSCQQLGRCAFRGKYSQLHEIYAHGGGGLLGAEQATEVPLAYGVFCATYDWCMAAYFYTRRRQWGAAWEAEAQ